MSDDRPLVLVTCPQMQRTIDQFRDQLDAARIVVELPEVVQALSEAELTPIIARYDGMIAGDDELSRRVLEQADRLRIISKWGVGTDGIDHDAAADRGIVVTNTPGTFGEEVADVAIGYLILLARQLHAIDRSVRDGGWAKPVGISITGKTLGVIGLGSIGQAVVRRGLGFGMRVLGFDVSKSQQELARALGAEIISLDELLRTSTFVSLNCPLTPESHHLIDGEALAKMRSDGYLINTARGPLVDETALEEAIRTERLAGAALDVFEHEPLSPTSPLRDLPGVILGSHNGSNTDEATLRVSGAAVANLIRGLQAVKQ